MHRIALGLAALSVLSACGGSADKTATVTVTRTETVAARPVRPKAVPRAKPTYAVADVVDGDTIRLGTGARVRLVQIDAPELSESECYSARSRSELAALIGSGRVRLEQDARLDQVDRFGRRLAYVFVGRKNVNLALVRRGAASVWFYDGDRGAYAGRLLRAARQAKASRRGLWGSCSATRLDPFHAVAAVRPAPPPPPPVAPRPAAAANCHPSYEGACLDPNASDYDCAGGTGNGPKYTGYVRVVGYDEFGLDADGDGVGCEDE